MSDEKLNLQDLRKPKSKKEEGSTSLSWGKNGDGSAVFSGGQEIPNDADIRALLEHVGKNPDDYNWEIISVSWNSSSWHRSEEVAAQSIKHSAFTAPSCVVKIKIEPKQLAEELRETSEDIAELCALVSKRKPSKPNSAADKVWPELSFLWPWSDLQAGKGEGGGSQGMTNRMGYALQRVLERLRELKKLDRNPSTVYIIGMGDLVEQCSGHYPMQAFQVDLDRRQQMKLVRRLLLEAINALVDAGYKVVLAAVPGNHGENRNSDGKAYTSWTDNDDVAIFEQVAEVLAANPERYANVSGSFDDQDLVVTLQISDIEVAFAHGHQFRNGTNPTAKAEGWWKGQALGTQRVANAKILVSGHYHHGAWSEASGRQWLQCPAQDGGSAWFTYTTGNHSPAGMLTFCVGSFYDRGWGDLEVI
jgi:hypothetical protein